MPLSYNSVTNFVLTPGGSNTNIQVNSSNTFYGDGNFTYLTSVARLGVGSSQLQGSISLPTTTGNAVVVAPSSATANWILTLPSSPGTSDYVLKTNGSGVTSWTAQSTGSGGGLIVIPSFDYTTVFYVSSAGSNVTGSGSSSNPWQTIQYAVNYAVENYYIEQNATVTIQLASGTYTEDIYLNGIQGSGTVVVSGLTSAVAGSTQNQTYCTINGAIFGYGPGVYSFGDMTLKNTGALAQFGTLSAYGNNNTLITYGKIDFGDVTGGPHISCPSGGSQGNIVLGCQARIMGTAGSFCTAQVQAYVEISHGTFDVAVAPGWSYFVRGDRLTELYLPTHNQTWTNTAGYSGDTYYLVDASRLSIGEITAMPIGNGGGTIDPTCVVTVAATDGYSYKYAPTGMVSKTSDFTIPKYVSDIQYDSVGSTQAVTFTLPAAVRGGKLGFCCGSSFTLTVVSTSAQICLGTYNSTGGTLSSTQQFSQIELEAISTSQWIGGSVTGSWAVT